MDIGGPRTSAATMARTSVALPPNIPRMGEVPTGTGAGNATSGAGGGVGAITGGIANACATTCGACAATGGACGAGRGGGGGAIVVGLGCRGAPCRAACARCACFRIDEITPITTRMIQMIPPMSCMIYRAGGGGCVVSGGVPSTLVPIASRIPVSACRFLSR